MASALPNIEVTERPVDARTPVLWPCDALGAPAHAGRLRLVFEILAAARRLWLGVMPGDRPLEAQLAARVCPCYPHSSEQTTRRPGSPRWTLDSSTAHRGVS